MKEILIQHIKTHPAITTQDILKLCYQATFGAEHLLMDREKAFLYFDKEWQMTPETDEPMVEILSCNYANSAGIESTTLKGLTKIWQIT